MILSDEQEEKCYTLFDDIQADATTGTNASTVEEATKMLSSILDACKELQKILQTSNTEAKMNMPIFHFNKNNNL